MGAVAKGGAGECEGGGHKGGVLVLMWCNLRLCCVGWDGARRFWDKGGWGDLNSLTLGAFLVKVALLKNF